MVLTFGEGDLASLRWHVAVDTVGCRADGELVEMPRMRILRRSASERVEFRPFIRAAKGACGVEATALPPIVGDA